MGKKNVKLMAERLNISVDEMNGLINEEVEKREFQSMQEIDGILVEMTPETRDLRNKMRVAENMMWLAIRVQKDIVKGINELENMPCEIKREETLKYKESYEVFRKILLENVTKHRKLKTKLKKIAKKQGKRRNNEKK